MNVPDTLRYTKNHEWVKLEDSSIGTIGITDFAQSELGDIVYIDIPTVGQEIKQNEVFGSIEAVKTVSDLFIPLTGKIIEINPTLEASPEKVNEAPYETGWLVKIEITDPAEEEQLLSSENYKALIGK